MAFLLSTTLPPRRPGQVGPAANCKAIQQTQPIPLSTDVGVLAGLSTVRMSTVPTPGSASPARARRSTCKVVRGISTGKCMAVS